LHKHHTDPQIAELIHHVNHAVFFNLTTDSATFPLDSVKDKTLSRR
jgi:hypothetical protein